MLSPDGTAPDLRIISLLPGATEMLVHLDLADSLVGISHECDWPAAVQHLPRVTTTPIDPSQSSGAIDRAVRDTAAAGKRVIGIDLELLGTLRPTHLVTQRLCEVCAVADGEVVRLAQALSSPPEVITLDGTTLDGVWRDIVRLGDRLGRAVEADRLTRQLRDEVATHREQNSHTAPLRVVAIEWLDPLFLAGHWIPEMIEAAGGIDVGATAGSHSTVRDWEEVFALRPDVVLVMLCGFDESRARRELVAIGDTDAGHWIASRGVTVLDGNAYTSRPGPRLVSGIRQIAEAIQLRRAIIDTSAGPA